jgi:uncharacterized membrane protein
LIDQGKADYKMTKNFILHLRKFIFRGLLAIIPILLCFFAIQLLYVLIDKKVVAFLGDFLPLRHVPGLGIVLLLAALYMIGLTVSNFIGHQLLKILENVTQRIPLIKTVYGVGKQLSQSLGDVESEKQAFKKAILVKINNDGLMVPGFVMGSLASPKTGEQFLFVLAPTAPTPGSGFVLVVKESQTIDPGWTIEECLKAIVSVGIVAPKEIRS